MRAQAKLHSAVSKIAAPLAYFDDLQLLGTKLGLPVSTTRLVGAMPSQQTIFADSPELLEALRRIDECIVFLQQHVRTPVTCQRWM